MDLHFVQASLDHHLRTGLDGINHGGVSLAVIHRGSATLCVVPAVDHFNDRSPIGVSTLFHLCSCSKSFLALTFSSLVAEGLISWDDRIGALVPEFALPDPEARLLCTFRDLACMRTGLSRDGIAEWGIKQDLPKDQRVARSRHMAMMSGFRQRFTYSNLAYIAIGLAIERLTGHSLADVQRELLFQPLGMADVWSGSTQSGTPENICRPVVSFGEMAVRVEDLTGPNSEGSARIHLSARAAIPWLGFLLEISSGNLRSKAAKSHAEVFNPQTNIQAAEVRWAPEGGPCSYGMGFFISQFRGHRLLHHGGAGRGWRVQCLVLPEADTALMLMASAESGRIDGLAFDLLEVLLNGRREGETWSQRIEAETRRRAEEVRLHMARQFPESGQIFPPVVSGYYQNQVTGRVKVSVEPDASRLEFEDAPIFNSDLLSTGSGTLIMDIDEPALKQQPLDPLFRLRSAPDEAGAIDTTYFSRLYPCS